MYRRELLQLLVCASITPLGACKRPRTRSDLMDDLVQRVLVPETRTIVRSSAQLVRALEAYASVQTAETLAAAQSALRTALCDFERAYALRKGPIVDTNALLRTTFFPTRTAAVADLVASATLLDNDAIEACGIDVKGLFAIEALLFGPTGDEHPERKRVLMVALAQNVSAYATKVADVLGDGRALAATWSADAQLTMSQIVNDMLASVETLATERVGLVVEMATRKRMVLRDVQGAASGTSQAILVAWLDGLVDIYGVGEAGLGGLVSNAAPAIDERMRARFAAARTAAQQLGGPLEHVAEQNRVRVEALHAALKALELAIKVDLTSALGITLTFTSSDGD